MRRLTSRLLGAALEGALISTLIVGLIVVPAFAAKGGGGKPSGGGDSGSSLVLVMTDATDTTANHGDVITFTVSTTATDKPNVNVRCTQDGASVYDAWAGFYPGAWFGQTFTLSSSYWIGGGAECNARLVFWARNGRERTVATMAFTVAP